MTALWALITGSAIGRALAKIGALMLAVLTFGAYQRRRGAQTNQAKTDAAQAKAHTETTKKVLHETVSSDPADAIRRRMRERAGKS